MSHTTPAPEPGGPTETLADRRADPFFPPADRPVPPLGATKTLRADEITLHLHYVVGGCEWWVAEYDPTSGLAYGYVCLGDPGNAEWGEFSLIDLEAVDVGLVVDRDPNWTPTLAPAANLPGWRA